MIGCFDLPQTQKERHVVQMETTISTLTEKQSIDTRKKKTLLLQSINQIKIFIYINNYLHGLQKSRVNYTKIH